MFVMARVCVQVCPVNVFEMIDSTGHTTADKKSDPVREADFIICMACEVQSPRHSYQDNFKIEK
jgi:NAD-dependent dihydropyrimidine dehydrogenase PreA subunit